MPPPCPALGVLVDMRMMVCYQIVHDLPTNLSKFVYECDQVDAWTQFADDFGKYWPQIPELKTNYKTNGIKNPLKIN